MSASCSACLFSRRIESSETSHLDPKLTQSTHSVLGTVLRTSHIDGRTPHNSQLHFRFRHLTSCSSILSTLSWPNIDLSPTLLLGFLKYSSPMLMTEAFMKVTAGDGGLPWHSVAQQISWNWILRSLSQKCMRWSSSWSSLPGPPRRLLLDELPSPSAASPGLRSLSSRLYSLNYEEQYTLLNPLVHSSRSPRGAKV